MPEPTSEPASGPPSPGLGPVTAIWRSPTVDARVREMFFSHSFRVLELVARLSESLALDLPSSRLEVAAMAHDLGMAGITPGILLKPAALDGFERAFVRSHPHTGSWICRDVLGDPGAAEIVLHQRERWDGGGYPDGLVGDAIPLGARVLAVPDVFDTLAFSYRPYQNAIWSVEDVTREIQRTAGEQFDPEVVDEFVLLLASDPDLRDPDFLEQMGRWRTDGEDDDGADERSGSPDAGGGSPAAES